MPLDPELQAWRDGGTRVKVAAANGLEVFVCDLGNPKAEPDSTLLVFHGFPESSFSYHRVVDGLFTHFERVVLFDFPGYGFSDKPRTGYSYALPKQADVALEIWQKAGIRGGHLLGHDMGDSVATELIAREVEGSLPDWFSTGFQSYTLTNGGMVLKLADLRIMQKLLLTRFGPLLSKISNHWLFRQQVKSAHGDAPLTDLEIMRLWEMNIHNGGRTMTYLTIKYLLDRRKYEVKRWLPALKATKLPIHICWGQDDHVAPVAMAHHLKNEVCPAATLTLMENTGHFAQIGSPEIWTKSVLGFF